MSFNLSGSWSDDFSLYAAGLFATDYAYLLTSPGTIAADLAGIAMILILLTANGYVRRRHYEFFYFAHVALIIASLITGPSHDINDLHVVITQVLTAISLLPHLQSSPPLPLHGSHRHIALHTRPSHPLHPLLPLPPFQLRHPDTPSLLERNARHAIALHASRSRRLARLPLHPFHPKVPNAPFHNDQSGSNRVRHLSPRRFHKGFVQSCLRKAWEETPGWHRRRVR